MADAGFRVRRVAFDRPADVTAYLDLLDAYARDPMGAGEALSAEVRVRLPADLAANPGAFCLLAEHASEPVAVATCFLGYSTFRAQPLLNIHDLAVLPAWRGRSAARTLLTTIEQLARDLGCCRITLEVRKDNPCALGLYERAGFKPAQCSLFMEKPV